MRPQSLADFLGVPDPRAGSASVEPETLIDVVDPVEFCRGVLRSREFRQYILNGMVLGEIPPAIICRVMDHAWGKPVERVEITDKSDDVDEMDARQCEAEAMRLLELARQLREERHTDPHAHIH